MCQNVNVEERGGYKINRNFALQFEVMYLIKINLNNRT